MKNTILLLQMLALFSLPLFLSAQSTTFQKTFGGAANDEGHDVLPLSDGNFIVTGAAGSFGDTSFDAYLLRVTGAGEKIWERSFGGPFQDGGNEMVQAPDGKIFVAGHTESYGNGDCEAYFFLINENGDTLWTRTFGTPEDDAAYGCTISGDGNFLSTGRIENGPNGADGFVIKFNEGGEILWSKLYGSAGEDFFTQICAAGDGNYFVSGNKSVNGDVDFWLMKIDAGGNELWSSTIGTTDADYAYGLCASSNGGALIIGKSIHTENNLWASYIVRTDADGKIIWQRQYDFAEGNNASSGVQTANGNFVICGTEINQGTLSPDIYLRSLDDNGVTEWEKFFGGKQNEVASRISLCSNGDFIFTGSTNSGGEGMNDLILIRTDAQGQIISTVPGVGATQRVLVYPNPADETAVIVFSPDDYGAGLSISDVEGRIVSSLEKINSDHLNFERSTLAAGVYLVSIRDQNGQVKEGKLLFK